MSHVRERTLLEKIAEVRSVKSFAKNFLLTTMAGQKLFLYNEDLLRVINLSFNEKTCMFSCKMCPYAETEVRDMYKSGSEMEFETLKNIVASIPNDPYYSFDISAIGETLQFKRLPEFIKYMKQERPLVNTIISTNGQMLTEKVFRALVDAGLDNLQISLFAQNARDHEFITGAKTFGKITENIKRAWEIRKELGASKPYMQTFMMECEETKQWVDAFLAEWSQYVDHAFVRPLYNLGREIEGMTPSHKKTPSSNRHPCIQPWYSTAIRSNGDVLPCYMFHWHKEAKDVVVGNINEKPLAEIWRSDMFRNFREAHRKLDFKDYPLCRDYDLWDAYTNVWSRREDGSFDYDRVKLSDMWTKAPAHRGA
jgi:radical SAM protein with 4Fe4S-binding SPASM domain